MRRTLSTAAYTMAGSSNIVFKSRVDARTGRAEWVPIDGDDYDYQQEIARAAFADMLHDTERVRCCPHTHARYTERAVRTRTTHGHCTTVAGATRA
jgi:hypothetical protein